MYYKYERYDAIPPSISSYLLSVADADNIAEISLEDINSFLNGLEAFANYIEATR